jgi:hypothetical protein
LSAFSVSPLTMLEWLNQKIELVGWQAIRLVALVIGFYACNYYRMPVEICIGVFSCTTAIAYGLLFLLNKRAIGRLIDGSLKI